MNVFYLVFFIVFFHVFFIVFYHVFYVVFFNVFTLFFSMFLPCFFQCFYLVFLPCFFQCFYEQEELKEIILSKTLQNFSEIPQISLTKYNNVEFFRKIVFILSFRKGFTMLRRRLRRNQTRSINCSAGSPIAMTHRSSILSRFSKSI